jgi:hypothetical protein
MLHRLPIIRPQSFEQCAFLGAPALMTRSRSRTEATRDENELVENDRCDEVDEDLDDELDRRAAETAEQLHAEGGVPCPFVGCADHLVWIALGVANPRALTEGALAALLVKLEAIELEQLPATCGRRGPYTLEQIGELFNVTRERIRQIETKALRKLRHPSRTGSLRPYAGDGVGVSRPDLAESSSIGLSAKAVATAAARVVPAMARDSAAARKRRAPKRSLAPVAPTPPPCPDPIQPDPIEEPPVTEPEPVDPTAPTIPPPAPAELAVDALPTREPMPSPAPARARSPVPLRAARAAKVHATTAEDVTRQTRASIRAALARAMGGAR